MSDENEVYEEEATPAAAKAEAFVPEEVEASDNAERDAIRNQLENDVEAFLAAGGQISRIPPNVLADPPKKPQSNYGGQPI